MQSGIQHGAAPPPDSGRRFAAIAVSYFMGLFNDNFYKEAALILAVLRQNHGIQAAAAAVFTVSYMLGAAPGGWLADRFAKGHVIIAAKAAELAAMIMGAFGVWYGRWELILGMIGLMGAQSAVFSPAMSGTLPELYARERVQGANTVIRILATAAIFIGMAAAGYVMDMQDVFVRGMPRGIFLVGALVLTAAAVGLAVSFGAPRIAPQPAGRHFPWIGPWTSICELTEIGRDRLLTALVKTKVFIWSAAAVLTLLMVNLGLTQLELGAGLTAGMKIVFLAGITAGGALSNVIARGRRFFGVCAPCYGLMALFLALVGVVPGAIPPRFAAPAITVLFAMAGIAGGIVIVPLESFIQIRPAANSRGRVIAAANFAVFAAMTFGAGVLYLLNLFFRPTLSVALIGAVTALHAVWLARRFRGLDAEIRAF